MFPLTQGFRDCYLTLRASLTRSTWVYSKEESTALKAYPFQQGKKLSKRCVNTFFTEHSTVESKRIQILRKNSLGLITQRVSRFQMVVFTSIRNLVVKSGYFDLSFLPVFRTYAFSRCSALRASFAGSRATPQTRLAISAHLAGFSKT
jgi:hypothetical protein